MAGFDWFRWHHGCVNDPKFGLIAKKASASVAEVIAVWACLLEAASASPDRGNPGTPDFEALDFALGLDEGKAEQVYSHMVQRGMIDQAGHISKWEERQPKRERQDDNSTERSRAYRARQRDATPCNASERQKSPREDKRREEEIKPIETLLSDSPTSDVPGSSDERGESGQARVVFEYWQRVMGHSKAKLDAKRRRAINARLREGYSPEQLCKAVDGCKASAYHMGQNDSGTVYDDIELICRDATKVDSFLKRFEAPKVEPAKKLSNHEQTMLNIQRYMERKHGT